MTTTTSTLFRATAQEWQAAFTRYYESRLARARAITPAQKLAVLDELECEVEGAPSVSVPRDRTGAFAGRGLRRTLTRGEVAVMVRLYYQIRLARADAMTPAQELMVLDELERELREAESLARKRGTS